MQLWERGIARGERRPIRLPTAVHDQTRVSLSRARVDDSTRGQGSVGVGSVGHEGLLGVKRCLDSPLHTGRPSSIYRSHRVVSSQVLDQRAWSSHLGHRSAARTDRRRRLTTTSRRSPRARPAGPICSAPDQASANSPTTTGRSLLKTGWFGPSLLHRVVKDRQDLRGRLECTSSRVIFALRAGLSRDSRNCPVADMKPVRWRPRDLPSGGHGICPRGLRPPPTVVLSSTDSPPGRRVPG